MKLFEGALTYQGTFFYPRLRGSREERTTPRASTESPLPEPINSFVQTSLNMQELEQREAYRGPVIPKPRQCANHYFPLCAAEKC
jgi:hypothetical protein